MKRLYWSSLNLFESCPCRFSWKYGVDGVDFGGGVGKQKPINIKRSEHDAIMGEAIQKSVEIFYNTGLWKEILNTDDQVNRMKRLKNSVTDLARSEFKKLIYSENSFVRWNEAPPIPVMEEVCVNGVVGYIKTIIKNHLVGTKNEAEKVIKVDNVNNSGVDIGAKIDVLITNSNPNSINSGVSIIDGKNTKYYGYPDPGQLMMYALCVFLETGRIPDRVGFVYYRFPFGTEMPDGVISTGVQWVKFDNSEIYSMIKRVEEYKSRFLEFDKLKNFPASPSPKKCMFCEWEDVCESRKTQKDANSGSRKKFSVYVCENAFDTSGFAEINLEDNGDDRIKDNEI